jgi:hypothetical protein
VDLDASKTILMSYKLTKLFASVEGLVLDASKTIFMDYTLTKNSHNISYMKISYMKSLYGIETNFIYEMLCENFIYEIFIDEFVSIPHKDFIYEMFHI